MLKGIPILKRNNAWHIRNIKRKAKKRISHMRRIAMYQRQIGNKMEAQHKASQAREKIGLWERFVAFIKRLIKPISWQTN